MFRFNRGCLEVPVHAEPEPFIWGVWVSLSKNSFDEFTACFETLTRSHIGPLFGWLSAELPLYPSTENLKTRVHLRDNGVRPLSNWSPPTILWRSNRETEFQSIVSRKSTRATSITRLKSPRRSSGACSRPNTKNAASREGSGVF